jgi:hypothetical protein
VAGAGNDASFSNGARIRAWQDSVCSTPMKLLEHHIRLWWKREISGAEALSRFLSASVDDVKKSFEY